MKIIKFEEPKITIVEDFLSQEECDYFLRVKDYSEELWGLDFQLNYPKEHETHEDLWPSILQWDGMCVNITRKDFYSRYDLDGDILDSLASRIKDIVADTFNPNIKIEQYLINRWRLGRGQAPHLDYFDSTEEGHDYEMLAMNNLPKAYLDTFEEKFQTKHYSSLVYLNEDYLGGELYFPQYPDIMIKPKPGTLILFSGNENTLHGVKEVDQGIRYTISIFWTDLAKVKGPNQNKSVMI